MNRAGAPSGCRRSAAARATSSWCRGISRRSATSISPTAFATLILEERCSDHVPLASEPIERAPFRVLESANMPAVLIEIGYLSNPAQEKLLASDEFQNAFVAGRARRDREVPRHAAAAAEATR